MTIYSVENEHRWAILKRANKKGQRWLMLYQCTECGEEFGYFTDAKECCNASVDENVVCTVCGDWKIFCECKGVEQ